MRRRVRQIPRLRKSKGWFEPPTLRLPDGRVVARRHHEASLKRKARDFIKTGKVKGHKPRTKKVQSSSSDITTRKRMKLELVKVLKRNISEVEDAIDEAKKRYRVSKSSSGYAKRKVATYVVYLLIPQLTPQLQLLQIPGLKDVAKDILLEIILEIMGI